jgi:hypothetical protein
MAKRAAPPIPKLPVLGNFEAALVVRIQYASGGRGAAKKGLTQVYVIPASALQSFAVTNPRAIQDSDSPLAHELDAFLKKYYKHPPVDAAYVARQLHIMDAG